MRPSSGQPLPRSAALWGSIIESAEDYQLRRRLGESGGGIPSFVSPAVIRVKNSSGADRRAGDILQLSSALPTTLDREHIWLDGVAPAAPLWTTYHGVLVDALPSNQIGPLQVAGVCLAYVNINDASHRRCDVAAATYTLQSCYAGPYQILQQPSGTGEKWCVVLLGPKRPSTGIAKLTGDLAAGSTSSTTSAAATLQKRNTSSGALESAAQTVTVRSYIASAHSTNDYVSVSQDDIGDWWLDESSSGTGTAQIEIATLTGTLAYGGSTTATIAGGSSVTVYDQCLSSGQTVASGKKVVIGYRLTDEKWYVIAAQCG